jgi:hypothetical protein
VNKKNYVLVYKNRVQTIDLSKMDFHMLSPMARRFIIEILAIEFYDTRKYEEKLSSGSEDDEFEIKVVAKMELGKEFNLFPNPIGPTLEIECDIMGIQINDVIEHLCMVLRTDKAIPLLDADFEVGVVVD